MAPTKRFTAQSLPPTLALAGGGLSLLMALAAWRATQTASTPLALAALGLLLVAFGLMADKAATRRALTSRSFKYSTLALYQSLVVLGMLVVVNVFAALHPWTRDLTLEGAFSLSTQTIKLVSSLREPVKILAFFPEDQKGRLRELLLQYERVAEGKFTWEFVNPDKNPTLTKKLGVTTYGTTIVQCGKNETKLTEVSEGDLTNAIVKVTRTEKKKIYLLAGHGERDRALGEPGGFLTAVKAMETNQYQVAELFLFREAEVPADAALVVLAGPKKPLFDNELQALDRYLGRNGKLVALLDPGPPSGMEPLLARWGVALGADWVIDFNPIARMMGAGPAMPVIAQYAKHQLTEGFNVATFFAEARSVSKDKDAPADFDVVELFRTSPQSYAEKDMAAGEAQFTPGVDTQGPISLAVAVRKRPQPRAAGAPGGPTPEPRLVVIGDSDFASNRYYEQQGNGNLFENAVNWAAQETDLLSITPKTRANTPLQLTQKDADVLFYTSVVFVPLFFLTAAGAVWYARRSL